MAPHSEHDGGSGGGDSSSNDGCGDGVGTELTKKGTLRQKRFTTRGRTGCLTCRSRHIKCDETKPFCRRCTSGRRECRGYDFGGSPSAASAASGGGSEDNNVACDWRARERMQEAAAGRHYPAEPEPPDWECMEAARYYCVFVIPCCEEQLMSAYKVLPPCHGPNRPIFLLDVSCHRIADASKSRGKLLRWTEDPSVGGAWASHSRHMLDILDFVNRGLSDKSPPPGNAQAVIRRIFTLLHFDLLVDASAWRPHLLGYIALMQHMGGVRGLLRLNNGPINNTQWTILIFATAANTTSPASKQLRAFEAYSDEDVEFLSSLDVNPDLPCPPTLFVVLKNLTQLRGRIAGGKCPKSVMNSSVRDLFDKISAFDRDTWAESVTCGSHDTASAMARIFQVAVRLFGVLSLPQSATASWAVAAGYPRLPGMSMYDSVRVSHRRELLLLLDPYRGTFKTVLSLAWPLTVAGVSLGGDGRVEDRLFIAESLLDMWKSRLARCGPILCLEKLRVFWSSNKTAWDDCFDEPVPPLA
ncbi:C6 zinc finger domain protein [Cordyceps fumosorosea ARSEF 2679]|uniref:C6 zinc finger domain protein n=1 Tax=Cordyceps fumosorosea (strain ARSEF 2679) TaxID=1081104 RepID=A0A168CLY8_CORFA|nr:C6 zinc finger domain protein [Cordyceps fumosorosea ARSEF 2679]OAA71540.1 C6 zinc finger domain protein [Cordyceps fumosorosea ARSEF 2679]